MIKNAPRKSKEEKTAGEAKVNLVGWNQKIFPKCLRRKWTLELQGARGEQGRMEEDFYKIGRWS